ncbi:MAG TPA: hypothetical protein VIK84_05645 [Haloplasmataceae bacterium]
MPTVFGTEHIIYLAIVIALMVLAIVLVKRFVKTDKQLVIIIKSIAFLLLLAIIWNRISIAIGRDNYDSLWPSSFCGTSSLVLALGTLLFKKDNPILHCVVYIGFLGGVLTLVYPDFIGQANSIFYPMTISGLLHHTLMVFLIILMFITGYFRPSLKKWKYLPIGLALYMVYGLFLITVVGLSDAMYIYSTILDEVKLNWFYLGLIFIPTHFLFLCSWELITRKKH